MNIEFSLNDLFSIAPLVIIFLTSLVPLSIKLVRKRVEQPSIVSLVQALGGGLVAAAWVAMGPRAVEDKVFGGMVVFDGLAWVSCLLALFAAAGTLVLAQGNINTKGGQFSEFIFLVLNAAVGMMTLICANDLLVVFVGLEIMSLAIYCLVAMSHEAELSKEAAFKYFVLGSTASAIFLFGVAFLFGTVGSTNLDALKEVGPKAFESQLFLIGFLLVLVGFAFKVSLFPFHFWTPDVYQGASTPITAFMSTGVKVASFIAFLRFLTAKGIGEYGSIVDVLQWIAIATMMVGNIGAILQENIKRMLAYSSVAHSGYLMLGVIAAATGAGFEGTSAVLFYLITYTLMNFGALAIVSLFEKYEESSVNLDDLRGLAAKRPWLSGVLSICLLSLAGIPPTGGFFGKLFLFSSAVNQGFMWLVVWAAISSIISVFYYLRPVMTMYMKEGPHAPIVETDRLGRFAAIGSAAAIIALGFAANPVFHVIQTSLLSMLN